MVINQSTYAAQVATLNAVLEKGKSSGWIESADDYDFLPDGTMVVCLFDRSRNKHWLHITPEGNACFSPVTLTCAGRGIF